jgi:hypothetical protein
MLISNYEDIVFKPVVFVKPMIPERLKFMR